MICVQFKGINNELFRGIEQDFDLYGLNYCIILETLTSWMRIYPSPFASNTDEYDEIYKATLGHFLTQSHADGVHWRWSQKFSTVNVDKVLYAEYFQLDPMRRGPYLPKIRNFLFIQSSFVDLNANFYLNKKVFLCDYKRRTARAVACPEVYPVLSEGGGVPLSYCGGEGGGYTFLCRRYSPLRYRRIVSGVPPPPNGQTHTCENITFPLYSGDNEPVPGSSSSGLERSWWLGRTHK